VWVNWIQPEARRFERLFRRVDVAFQGWGKVYYIEVRLLTWILVLTDTRCSPCTNERRVFWESSLVKCNFYMVSLIFCTYIAFGLVYAMLAVVWICTMIKTWRAV
jgi:hypothetical protein